MKTTNKAEQSTSTAKKAPVKGFRKLLQPLQVSATDKENLVGAGRSAPLKDVLEKPGSKQKETREIEKPAKTTITIDKPIKSAITIEDLTSDTPSANYWELKCKQLTKSLEETLTENRVLHERIKLLEEENELCKQQLYETAEIVTCLTEIINEPNDQRPENDQMN